MGCIIEAARSRKINAILHCVNCFHVMGAGVAKAIREEWPGVFLADLKTPRGDRSKMGTFSFHQEGGLVVINLYAQYRYSRLRKQSLEYPALRRALRSAAERLNAWQEKGVDVRVGYPLLGCGLAGGNWEQVKEILDEELEGLNHQLYTL
jgi:O-acetyl-ADP-ribose deacetylase (regulator of RNase III)